MKRWLFLLLVLLCVARSVDAAGTVAVTTTEVRTGTGVLTYVQYSVAWTSTAGGAVSANAFTIVPGDLVSARFIPGSGGTQPSDLYDVTIAETNGLADLLLNAGADRSNATVSLVEFDPPLGQDGTRTIDVVVANAGASKTGTVVILVKVR